MPRPPDMVIARLVFLLVAVAMLVPATAAAGPPFDTDDPEPVEYRHWEFYVAASRRTTMDDSTTGTAPQFEVNYGALPGVQLHLIVPLGFARPTGGPSQYGKGDVELGAKLRLVEEGARRPMVGIFPHVEVPSGSAAKGLGAGKLQAFIPLWVQKSFGPWTTYGGAGYWVNPGTGNRNWAYVGWLLQRRLSSAATLGAEAYRQTADHVGGNGDSRFNLGLILDLSDRHHLLFSAGRSIAGAVRFQGYAAYQLTL
jgi:hypothetical protein